MKTDVIKTRFLFQGISILLLTFFIPLQLTIQKPLKDNSLTLLKHLQSGRSDNFAWGISWIQYINPNLLHSVICPFILNFYHPLRAPKTILFFCLSLYLANLFCILFQEGRPFWYSKDIKPKLCLHGFGNPSCEVILSSIVLGSISIEFLHKHKHRNFIYLVPISFILFISFSFIYLSEYFPHQIVNSLFISFILITLNFSFEKDLLKLSNRFSQKYYKNRVYIVYWFLACLSMILLFCSIDLLILIFSPESPKTINRAVKHCSQSYEPNADHNIRSSSNVFYIFGYVAGSLMLSKKISVFYTMTSYWKKCIRFFITAGTCFGIYLLFGKFYLDLIPAQDFLTREFFHSVVPNLICSLIMTLGFPFIFKWMKLILVIPVDLTKGERKKLFSFKKSVI